MKICSKIETETPARRVRRPESSLSRTADSSCRGKPAKAGAGEEANPKGRFLACVPVSEIEGIRAKAGAGEEAPEREIPRLRSGLGFPQFLNNPEKFRKAVKA